MQIDHTYLVKPGCWKTTSTSFTGTGKRTTMSGQVSIQHDSKQWIVENEMQVQNATGQKSLVKFATRIPTPRDPEFIVWRQQHPTFGTLIGYYSLVNDTILSRFDSADGKISVRECMLKLSDTQYHSSGYFLTEGRCTWVWQTAREYAGEVRAPREERNGKYDYPSTF